MKRLGHGIAAVCVLVLVLTLSAFAQEHGAAQPAAQGGQQATAPAEQPAAGAEHGAAEHDEHAQFKESASVQFIARKLGIDVKTAYWISVILNFVIVLAVIFWILRKVGMAAAMRERTVAIRREMEEARKASEEAQRRLADVDSRLGRLDVEIAELRSGAENDARAEEERIRATAEEDKQRIVETAGQEIASMSAAARRELRAYAAGLAVDLAEKRIQVDPEMDKALVGEFARNLGDGKKGS